MDKFSFIMYQHSRTNIIKTDIIVNKLEIYQLASYQYHKIKI